MFIKSIIIKTFKCFKDETIEFKTPNPDRKESGLNIFVGENNSGKTNAIEAFLLMLKKDYYKVVRGNDEDLNNRDTKEKYEIVLELIIGKEHKQIKKFINGDNVIKIKKQFDKYGLMVFNPKQGEYETSNSYKKNLSELLSEKELMDYEFMKAYEKKDKINELISKFLSSSLGKKGKEEFRKILNKKIKESFDGRTVFVKTLKNNLNEYFPDREIIPKYNNLDFLFKHLSILTDNESVELEGEGMQKILLFSAILASLEKKETKPLILFIDEPETFLHPQAQKQLFETLKQISQKAQVFISTHSPYFVDSDSIENVFRFENKKNKGTKIFSCKDKEVIKKFNEKENKIFFFHHRDLFFTRKAIFFEGAEDYKRFSFFCEKNNFEKITQDFYFLAGKDDWSGFKKLCDELKISAYLIFDLDVISKNNNTFSDESLKKEIKSLNKDIKRNPDNLDKKHPDKKQQCEPLFDENLNGKELRFKNKILKDLKKQNIFVLRHGMLENYLDRDGKIVGNKKEEKKEELKNIFNISK